MTRFLLVRHGQSAWNALGRWQGQADPPLSPKGEEQARRAAKKLDGFAGRVVASDLERAYRTAEIIAGGPVLRDPGLRERDVGQWSGLTKEEIEERFPGYMEGYKAGRLTAPPGGEDNESFRARIWEALRRVSSGLLSGTPDEELLVVTHGGCISAVERQLDCYPGEGVPNLGGRWFALRGDDMRVLGDRIEPLGHEGVSDEG